VTFRRGSSERHWAPVRRARSGAASNFWKGGVSNDRENIGRWTTQAARRVHERFDFRCAICNSKRRLHAHHVDPVWHNAERARDESNLLTLCARCHDAIQANNLELELLDAVESKSSLAQFWEGRSAHSRQLEKRLPRVRKLVRQYARVVRIEYLGEKMTYDLEVGGPHHNFVANGFIVHNSINEYSGRYSLMPLLFHMPSAEQLQTQSKSNQQGRSGAPAGEAEYREAVERWNRIRSESASAYEWLTSHDIARELARIDLPLSTYTQWYWKIDLHNLLHFLKLRVDAHAQWEIQEYGRVMAGMLKKVAPHSYEAWIDYDVCGARMSRMELDALRRLVQAGAGGLASEGGRLDLTQLSELGLSKREVDELCAKLQPASVPDFELDPRRAQPPEAFAERMAQAVPKVDKGPVE